MAGGRTDLDRSARTTATGFSQVAGRLTDVRGSLSDLCANLVELAHVLERQRTRSDMFDVVSDSVRGMQVLLDEASRVAAPQRFDDAARKALTSLAEIASRTRELGVVASLTLVSARSLGMAGFDDYVANLRALGTQMRTDVDSLNLSVTTLRTRRATAAMLFARAGHSLDGVARAIAIARAERAATDALLSGSLGQVRSLSTTLPRLAGAETENLVRAMQFADAVAQRLDHIGMISARPDPASQALARAQIEALSAETRHSMQALGTSLDRIANAARDAAGLLAADDRQGASPAAEALALVRKVLTQLAEGSAAAMAAIDGAAGESAAVQALSEEAATRFSSVFTATAAVHLSAINAALLARVEEGQEKTMNVLSMEVRAQAAACEKASTACHTAIAQLSLPDDLLAFSRVSEGAQTFGQSVAETAGAVETAGEAIAELHRLRAATRASLDRLSEATSDAHQSLQTILAATDLLNGIAETLPAQAPGGLRPPDDLMDIYTMEAERAVHRRFFGMPDQPPASAPVPAPEEDPLAAILF